MTTPTVPVDLSPSAATSHAMSDADTELQAVVRCAECQEPVASVTTDGGAERTTFDQPVCPSDPDHEGFELEVEQFHAPDPDVRD